MSKHRAPTRWPRLSTRINVGSVLLALGIGVMLVLMAGCAQPVEEAAAEPQMTQAEALEELRSDVTGADPYWVSFIPYVVKGYCRDLGAGLDKEQVIDNAVPPGASQGTVRAANLIWTYATEYEC